MSGGVLVLKEPDAWVVACFRTDCPEHGDGTGSLPWVESYENRWAANEAATEHRDRIKAYWSPSRCDSCGQRMPESHRTAPVSDSQPANVPTEVQP